MKLSDTSQFAALEAIRGRKPTTSKLTAADLGITSTVKPAGSQHDQMVEQSQKWVAQTFFGTLLKQMRESPFKSDLFEGGRGGQAFGSLYDQQMAEHMAKASGSKLVNAIVRKIEAKQAYAKQQPADHDKGEQPAGVPSKSSAYSSAAQAASAHSTVNRGK